MTLLHHPALFRAYPYLPHGLLNGAMRLLGAVERPQWAVELAIRAWVKRDGIDLTDFAPGPWPSLESFFLRGLREGARPIGDGLVSPADGIVVGAGACDRGTILQVKGKPISVDRLVHGSAPSDIDLTPFESYATVFLTPRGYHHVHCPLDARVEDVRWIPGRFFPQNEVALRHVDAIYERNERAVLRLSTSLGPMLLVMVGASLIGGIHLRDASRDRWVKRTPTALGVDKKKGEPLGHFTFGSTVVMLLPRGASVDRVIGDNIRMGEALRVERIRSPGTDAAPRE